MKKQFRKLTLLVVAALAVFAFTSCGDDDDNNSLSVSAQFDGLWTITSASVVEGDNAAENVTAAFSGYTLTLNGDATYTQVGVPSDASIQPPGDPISGTWSLSGPAESPNAVILGTRTVNFTGVSFTGVEVTSATFTYTIPSTQSSKEQNYTLVVTKNVN